jgi:predicted DNA-binding protein with PD1-like motif
MRTQLLTEHAGLRTFALVFDTDDNVMTLLLEAARELGLTAASFTGIGAFREVTLG